MSKLPTQVLLEPYIQERRANTFLLQTFTEAVLHDKEEICWDEEFDTDLIAPVITVFGGANENVSGPFARKTVAPATYNERFTISAEEKKYVKIGELQKTGNLLSPQGRVAFLAELLRKALKLGRKVTRSMTKQVADALSTGTIQGTDVKGNVVYSLAYPVKASHFLTAGTAWSDVTAPIKDNLTSLADAIRDDFGQPSDALASGAIVEAIKKSNDFKDDLNFRHVSNLTELEFRQVPEWMTNHAAVTFHGTLQWGEYKIRLWSFNDTYTLKEGDPRTKYLNDSYFYMWSQPASGAKIMQATFGKIHRFDEFSHGMEIDVAPRLSDVENFVDLNTHAVINAAKTAINVEVGTRGAVVIKMLDAFGRIDTGV